MLIQLFPYAWFPHAEAATSIKEGATMGRGVPIETFEDVLKYAQIKYVVFEDL